MSVGLVLAYASSTSIVEAFGLTLMLAGLTGIIVIPVWAAIDASRVVKV